MDDPISNVSEAEAEVKRLAERIANVQAQLEAERAAGPFTLSGLQAEVAKAREKAERAFAAAEKGKARANKRKDEIDEWKAWYNSLPDDEKVAGLGKLQSEIRWRAAELEILTPQIRDLLAAQATALGNMELAQQRLTAFEVGVYERPVEDDPRLTNLQLSLKAARSSLNRIDRS